MVLVGHGDERAIGTIAHRTWYRMTSCRTAARGTGEAWKGEGVVNGLPTKLSPLLGLGLVVGYPQMAEAEVIEAEVIETGLAGTQGAKAQLPPCAPRPSAPTFCPGPSPEQARVMESRAEMTLPLACPGHVCDAPEQVEAPLALPLSRPDAPLVTAAVALVAAPAPRLAPSMAQAPPPPEAEPGVDPALESGADAAVDSELGILRVRSALQDSELGVLRIRQQPILPLEPPPPPAVGFFTARLSAVNSDNIFLVLNEPTATLTGDQFLRPGLTLAAYPPIGPQTYLLSSMDVGFQRYLTESAANYDDLQFRLGLWQNFTPRTYGQALVTYQQLFYPTTPRDRFYEDTGFAFSLGRRDPLTPQLMLDTSYQAQLNFSEPAEFNRVVQSASTYLGYDFAPQWETGVIYRLMLSDYTGQARSDTSHLVLGQMVYSFTPQVRLSVYGAWSFGRSSDPLVRFEDTFFGFTIDATVSLF